MAYKLKNLQITSTDLVDQGANPEAHIGLMKRNFGQRSKDFVAGLFPPKENAFLPYSVPTPPTQGRGQESSAFEDHINKNHIIEEETPMTEEEILKRAEEIAKARGMTLFTETTVEKSVETEVEVEVSEDVAKALEPSAEVMKSYESKIAKLEETVALGALEKVAKKYEDLGYEPQELAKKLYEMKQNGVYEDYVALLEKSLSFVDNQGVFSEVGKSTSESLPQEQLLADIVKRDGCTREEAFMKAYAENPDFARAYDAGYVKE
ncbi:MAG: hypothetical protein R3Y63_08960 [Eubacteriales bacterium]